jgi:pimeloyl-ACP methyl ester carboxylesterase
VSRRSLTDEEGSFDVTVLEAPRASRTVLFAVGAGGNPERHLPLLATLADGGCTVVAPHFDRIGSPRPDEAELLLRARRLRLALSSFAAPGVAVAGLGHSIGTTLLIALADGQGWMRAGHRLPIEPDARIERLALLAPATGFFQAPGALDAVRAPILAFVGANDTITPPAQAELLREARGAMSVEVRVVEDAAHFSFMNTLPPHVTDSLSREAFLADLGSQVCRFVTS